MFLKGDIVDVVRDMSLIQHLENVKVCHSKEINFLTCYAPLGFNL